MRYPIIDGFRGFFLLFMMIIHLNLELETLLGRFNHHYLGWVEDAQGFVFISGFVVGLVYGGILLRKSASAMRLAIRARMRTIYSHQAGLILIFLVAALALAVWGIAPAILRPYVAEPAGFTVASLALVAASSHMGILPMYLYFMAVTPLVLVAFARGHATSVVLLSALAWMFAQTGAVDLVTRQVSDMLATLGLPIRLGIFFNIFGWQVLFVSGLWLGFRSAEGKLDLGFLRQASYTVAAVIAFAVVAIFALFDRIIYWDLVSPDFSTAFLAKAVRQDFSPVHVLNFAFDLFLVTWILVAGRTSGVRMIAAVSHAMTWLFTRRALVMLGQHSLHVFSFHLLVVYAAAVAFDGGPPDELTGTVLLLAGALSLYLPAWLHARMQKVDAAKVKASRQEAGKPGLKPDAVPHALGHVVMADGSGRG